jgi:regulator of cell morphogenesis and NO signaling
MMEQDHESAGQIMTELIQLTNHFEPPSWACATHIALFAGLRAFEADLTQHVHLENDVLFPRAIQLEAELKKRS